MRDSPLTPERPERSELPPEETEYWERLAGRIDAAVAARSARSDFAWLATHGARVGGAGVAVAAVLLAWVLMQPTFVRAPATGPTAAWRQSIAPSDLLGRALAVEQAPGLGVFLLAASRAGAGSAGDRP